MKIMKPLAPALLLILCAHVAQADPPGSMLQAVEVKVGKKIHSGFTLFGIPHPEEVLPGPEFYPPSKFKESLERTNGKVYLYGDLKKVDRLGTAYFYTQEVQEFPSDKVLGIRFTSSTLNGFVSYFEPVLRVDKKLYELLDGAPVFQCTESSSAGCCSTTRWVSYNTKIGEAELKNDCERTEKPANRTGVFGRHEKFKDVYWLAFPRD